MRAFFRFFFTWLVCLIIVLGGYLTTASLTGNIAADSFFFNPNSHRSATITANSDTSLDIAANSSFCLFRDGNKVDVICSTPDPRPGSPNAVKLTTTLKTGKWSVFTANKDIDMYLESDPPLVYNMHNIVTAIVIDVILFLLLILIVFMVAEANNKDN